MASRPGKSDSPASRSSMAFLSSSGGRSYLFGQKAYQWRGGAVRHIESQPLITGLRRREERAFRQQNRLIPRASHQLIHRRALGKAAPNKHPLSDVGIELDSHRLETLACVPAHARKARANLVHVALVAAAVEHFRHECLEQR